MAQYVTIYCNAKALKDAPYSTHRPQDIGKCLAQKVAGGWACCCCGKPVRVVLR